MPQPSDAPREEQDRAPATTLALSLIVPAYNESLRLPPYLESIREYLGKQYADDYEVVVVDDGSSDDLAGVLAKLGADWTQLRIVRHGRNLGKGAAVRTGVLTARGDRLLYADADGATPIDQEQKLRDAIDAGSDIAIGSRLLRSTGVERKRTWHRALIGWSFASAVRLLLKTTVKDTQCGFKMLRAGPAKRLFELSQERGYLFDLEILAIADRCGYRVTEVPINWSDQPDSRLKMHREFGRIAADLWRVRRRLAGLSIAQDPSRG